MQDNSPRPGDSDYLDFDLEIGIGTGRDYPIAVLDSPAGSARGNMHFPFDELVLENRLLTLQNALLRSGGEPRRTLSSEEQAVRDFGQALFEALFTPEVRSCYDVSLREAARQGRGLRLKLRIQPPELAALPWEYLYHPGQGEYVSLSTQTPVVRFLEVPQRVQPLTVEPPLRVLGMIASPSDLPSLDVEREKGRIEHAIRDLRARGLIDLEWLSGQCWRDLQRAMRQGTWHIFHFIGHGGFDRHTGEGLIVLADGKGRAARFHATQLGRLLADHTSLRLVLLNSCESARGSERDVFSSAASVLVRRRIPAVVAMQYEITDRAAVEFARTFYEALADGMPVDGAVAEARKAISFALANTVEWGTPVLYTRAPGGVLFEVAEQERRAALDGLYRRAVQAVEAGQWQEAQGLLTQVQEMEAGYRETERLLAKADAEIEASRKPAALAVAVPPKRRLPRWAMAAIAGLAVIALIVGAVLLRGELGGIESTATPTPTTESTPEPTDTPAPPVDTPHSPPTVPSSSPPASAPVPGPVPTNPTSGSEWEWSDGSAMVYVPAGEFPMGSTSAEIEDVIAACVADGYSETDCKGWYGDEDPQHKVYLDAFWIDRTEVTNAQYRRCVDDGACSPPAKSESYTRNSYYNNTGFEGYPVIYVNWEQAKAYCTWTGKRLPTEAEWEKAARGDERRTYPWGEGIDCSRANYGGKDSGCQGDTVEVGSYPSGESPYGVLDMAGNVWEWMADWYDSDYYANSPHRNPLGPDSGEWRVVRGGSWLHDQRSARAALRINYDPSFSSHNLGFRCARSDSELTPAPTPSLTLTPTPGPTDTPVLPTDTPRPPTDTPRPPTDTPRPPTDTPRPPTDTPRPPTDTPVPPTDTPRPVPEAGSTRIWEPDGSVMVYVPAGTFWMGSTDANIDAILVECSDCSRDAFIDEPPQHEVYLDALWIDRTEVTNRQYQRCVEGGACSPPRSSGSYTRNSYYGDPAFNDYPVIYVNWNQANAYCAWAGKRLPTEAEWEKAARGTEGLLYPWRGAFDGRSVNFCDANCTLGVKNEDWDDGYADTAPVGSYEDGASLYGALDMAGNVWEWVADWYDEDYYAGSPYRNPPGPNSGTLKVLRGGSWVNEWFNVRAANRGHYPPTDSYRSFGFRCAVSPGE